MSTVDQEIAIQVIRQKDDTMAQGEEEVVQVGQPGLELSLIHIFGNDMEDR